MFLLILVAFAFAATPTPTSITPSLIWQKPVSPSVDPTKATVVVVIKTPFGLAPSYPAAWTGWEPDGMIVLIAPEATRSNILAALTATKGYGHVIVDFEMPGIGGDFGDPYLVPFGANSDDIKAGLRPSEVMKALQGNQTWVAIISNTSFSESTMQGQAMIGPDASQWLASTLPGSNVFVLAAASGDKVPSSSCDKGWHMKLTVGLNDAYNTGNDLTFYDLTTAGLNASKLMLENGQNCNFAPEAKYQGSISAKSVMLTGSGIVPEQVVVLPPKFTPVVDPVTPLTSVLMTDTVEPADKQPAPVLGLLSFAAGGGCLVGGVVESVVYQNHLKAAQATFANGAVQQNFTSEAEADQAFAATEDQLRRQGNLAIGLYGCAGLGAALGTTFTLVF